MDECLKKLLEADSLLDTISVKGNDTFTLVTARKIMKVVYDIIANHPKDNEGENTDGR